MRIFNTYLLFSVALGFVSCSKGPSKAILIEQIKDVKKIATTEFVFSKYILAQKDNKLVFFTVGKASFGLKTICYVKTGVDLDKLQADDVLISNSDISVKLPRPEILFFSMPPSGLTKIEELTDVSGLLPNKFTMEEFEEQLREAELQIRNTVDYVKNEETVKKNTEEALKVLLKGLGFKNISINFQDN